MKNKTIYFDFTWKDNRIVGRFTKGQLTKRMIKATGDAKIGKYQAGYIWKNEAINEA